MLLAAILGSSIAFVEGSVVGLALPRIQAWFGVDSMALQWVSNGYLLLLGACMLPGGIAGDRFGLRRVFVLGTVLFSVGAILCALAPSFSILLAARALQGLGGALLVPNSLALISVHYPVDARAEAIGRWAGAAALTTAAGPVLGGVLVDELGWRSVFLVVVPVACAAIAVTLLRVPPARPASNQTIDWLSAALLVLGLGLALLSLTRAAEGAGGSVEVVTAGLGGMLLVAFWRRQRRASAPMLPPALLANRAFVGANLVTALLYAGLGAALYFLPFQLIQGLGYSATQAGAALLPFTLIIGFGSGAAGRLMGRLGTRTLLVAGPVLAGVGLGLLAASGAEGGFVWGVLPGVTALGVGMALSVAPLTAAVMAAVDDESAGVASGINNTASRLAGLLAVALATVLAVTVFRGSLATQLANLALPGAVRIDLLGEAGRLADLPVPEALPAALRVQVAQAVTDAFTAAFRWIMALCAVAAGCAAVVSALTLREGSPT
ncbi:MAG: MFS transporter [Pseudomonadota bacterium]